MSDHDFCVFDGEYKQDSLDISPEMLERTVQSSLCSGYMGAVRDVVRQTILKPYDVCLPDTVTLVQLARVFVKHTDCVTDGSCLTLMLEAAAET